MLETPHIKLQFQDAFESPSEGAPLYLTRQEIAGFLKISGLNARRVVVKFTFSGHLMNCIGFESNGYIKPPNLSFNRDIYECSIVQELLPSLAGHSVPFRFPFDRRFIRCDELSEGDEDFFPPSLEANSLKLGQRGGYSKVTYSVKATLLIDGSRPISTRREVRVIDERVPQGPPIWTEGFGKEYTCSQRRTMKTTFGLPNGRLSINASEPTPIELGQGQKSMLAEVPIKLLYEGMPTTYSIIKSWTATVDWTVKASTFVSTVAMRSLPTVEQAEKSPFMRVSESTVCEGRSEASLTFERRLISNSPNTMTWAAAAFLNLDIVPDHLPPPTFSSSFVTRRYIIRLRLKVSGEGSAFFALNVPLQFTYSCGAPPPFSLVRDRGSIDTLLPQYVR